MPARARATLEEAQDDAEAIMQHATPKLLWHITQKGFQAGGVLSVPACALAAMRARALQPERLLRTAGLTTVTALGLTGVFGRQAERRALRTPD